MWSMSSGRPRWIPAEALQRRDALGETPEPLPIALVVLVVVGGADLGAGRRLEDLGGRGGQFVVEVAEDQDGALLSLAGEQLGRGRADGNRFGGAAEQGVGGEPAACAFVAGREPAARKGQQLRPSDGRSPRSASGCRR